MKTLHAKFAVGQIIHHRKFDYRGVIVDVDATYQGSDEWYEQMARSLPPKDQPWYHVLVHQRSAESYVAERHLEPDDLLAPVEHPYVSVFFESLQDGVYVGHQAIN